MIYQVRLLESETSIDVNLDLSSYITESSGIIAIDSCHVVGTIYKTHEAVTFDIRVIAKMVLADTLTLDPVPYDLDFPCQIVFSDDFDIMDYAYADKIDLPPYIYAYILTEKPTSIYQGDKNQEDEK